MDEYPVEKSSKTRAKNVIKILPRSTRIRRNAKTELESFLKFIKFNMIDEIVRYINIYIEKKRSDIQYTWARACKDISPSEMMVVFRIFFMLIIKKESCKCRQILEI